MNFKSEPPKRDNNQMLNIIFGDTENSIYNTSVFFKNTYDPEWFQEEMTKKMILDVDKSEVLGESAIKSPVLGVIPPTSLYGGVKTLILIDHMPERIFNASACGDNCSPWILRIAENKDITINLHHAMNFGDENFNAKILNSDKIIHNMDEFLHEAGEYL